VTKENKMITEKEFVHRTIADFMELVSSKQIKIMFYDEDNKYPDNYAYKYNGNSSWNRLSGGTREDPLELVFNFYGRVLTDREFPNKD